jgi:hypothetical protein
MPTSGTEAFSEFIEQKITVLLNPILVENLGSLLRSAQKRPHIAQPQPYVDCGYTDSWTVNGGAVPSSDHCGSDSTRQLIRGKRAIMLSLGLCASNESPRFCHITAGFQLDGIRMLAHSVCYLLISLEIILRLWGSDSCISLHALTSLLQGCIYDAGNRARQDIRAVRTSVLALRQGQIPVHSPGR